MPWGHVSLGITIKELALRSLRLVLFGFVCCCSTNLCHGRADVVVYGAIPHGIAAAVNAAKGGHDVLLVEPTSGIGGLLTCGLSFTDFRSCAGRKFCIGTNMLLLLPAAS